MYKTAEYDKRLHSEGAVAIHIGMYEDDAHKLLPKFWAWAEDSHTSLVHDRASWEVWGESRDDHDQPMHIVILTLHPDEMIRTMAEMGLPLQPMMGLHGNRRAVGTTWVVSDPFDWSIQYNWSHARVRVVSGV